MTRARQRGRLKSIVITSSLPLIDPATARDNEGKRSDRDAVATCNIVVREDHTHLIRPADTCRNALYLRPILGADEMAVLLCTFAFLHARQRSG